MKPIQMVDLQTQYQSIKPQVKQAIESVLDAGTFINGHQVSTFSENLAAYLDVKYVIPCANGTDALQVALMSQGFERGDEVITADFTFVATVEVIVLLGLKPVLVDVEKDTFNISVEAIECAITPKTKAIVPVHLFGQTVAMEKIMLLAKKYNLVVIEDNAQAIGATHTFANGDIKKAGTIGHLGTTSFFPSKNLGCYGDGGAILTNDDALAYKIKGIVNHGMYQRYKHKVLGVNSRLDSVQAVILDIKLRLLDDYNTNRRLAAKRYNEAFEGIATLKTPYQKGDDSSHVYHQYTLQLSSHRDELVDFLSKKGIPTGVYYPIPIHRQDAYKDTGKYNEDQFEVTNELVENVISLPMHTELTDDQITYITSSVITFLKLKG